MSGVDPTGYYKIPDNCSAADMNCSKANYTIKQMQDDLSGQTDNGHANRFQLQNAGANKIGNSLTLAGVLGDVSSIGSQVAMNQYGNVSFGTGIYSFVQFSDGGESLMSLRSTMNKFAADTVKAHVENAKNKVENSKKKAAHVAGFFTSEELKRAGLRGAQTIGGLGELGAAGVACFTSAGLGCGYAFAFAADGLSNIQDAYNGDEGVGFLNQGLRNVIPNDQIADGVYTLGSLGLSIRAFTALVPANSPSGGIALQGAVSNGKPYFIRPPLRTVPGYRTTNAFGISRDALTSGGSIVNYFDSLYGDDL